MHRRLAAFSVLVLSACATASVPAAQPLAGLTLGQNGDDTLRALSAMCRAEDRLPTRSGREAKLGTGVGTGGFKADTTNAEAQAWFDYGLALSHAFYHEDAKQALIKSAKLDPTCSICAWGEAWGRGPTLNYSINDAQRLEALAAAERAKAAAKPGDVLATRLADSLVARFQKDVKSGMPLGLEMKAIADANLDNTELSVLAAHALMMPFNFGDDDSGIKPAIALIERVLKVRPDDTGAIHYYIHATEFDGHAEDAIPYANKLGRLAPKASHLIHMPAHTFFRAGRYQDAAIVNAEAIGADGDWTADSEMNTDAMPMYYAHNLAFGLGGALMSGDGGLALRYAEHAKTVYAGKPETMSRYPVPRTYVALARYAPDRALALTDADGKDPRFALYRHYARGEAYLLKGDLQSAKREADAVATVAGKTQEQGRIARDVLRARILMAQGRHAKAAKLFDKAAKLQEAELNDYMDPPAWWYPVRRSVAAAYLKAGDFARAETEAKASLSVWKHDPLALWVLGKAQAGLGKSAEADASMAEAQKAWRGDFRSITADAI